MEKKTIGGFIAALRRANGMTQKELAERLNVSDKTVSRWECNDGAPDLSVIPVIAEIFDVTCDELLRGERMSPTAEASEQTNTVLSPKAEKQRQRLLATQLARYRSSSWISMGISLCGLIAAMVANMGFLRAYIGFFLGAVFYLAAAISQAIWINHAFLTGATDISDDPEIGYYRHSVIRQAELSLGLIAVLFGTTLPLLILPNDAYVGLSAGSWLLYGLLFGAAALLIACVICFFLNNTLLNHGIYTLPEKEAVRYHHNRTLKKRCVLLLIPALVITLIAHIATTEIWGPRSIMKGTSFDDYDSFVAYMEQDIPYYHFSGATVAVEPLDGIYYDADGNEISEEDAMRRTLTLHDGTVVCEYIARNQTVCSVRYTERDGTLLPITVCTYDDLQAAQGQVRVRHTFFAIAYLLETILAFGIYYHKRVK